MQLVTPSSHNLLDSSAFFRPLSYIRFLLHIPWDELWAIIRASRSLLGDRTSEKLCILLKFTLRSTENCPAVYPWPLTCRDLTRGCTRLLLDQDRFPNYQKIIPSWAKLIRLSLPCDDLLADIRNLWPSPNMGGFYIHNVLEWLKTFPQPPLDVTERWQKCLEECRQASHPGTSYYRQFKEYEARWAEFQKLMASRRQQKIEQLDGQIVACQQN
ncbi:hypothetical protein FB451DRAFT_722791 [Mycena latifolia]|nr:hypothetical protein FB451DRAFT_722791 [Mycena latifolia]